MTKSLINPTSGNLTKDAAAARVKNLIEASKSKSTRRVYSVQFRMFSEFCAALNLESLPASPETVAAYISQLVARGLSVSSIDQALAAIREAHNLKGIPSPTDDRRVKMVMRGARRAVGVAVHKKAAINPAILSAMIDGLDLSTPRGLRDRAVLLLGFAGAFRRSEIAALTVDDFAEVIDAAGRRAYIVTVRRSKTDQEGAGMEKAIFTAKEKTLDPVRAIDEYREAAGVTSGALFRRILKGGKVTAAGLNGESVATIIKDAAAAAGVTLDIGGHSLRAGFVTSAINAGASERSIMNQTGHKSVTVMRGYQRRASVLTDNAAAVLL